MAADRVVQRLSMIVRANHNLTEFMLEVVEHAAALFFLLDGSERLQPQTASGDRKPPPEREFGPSSLSVSLVSMAYAKGSLPIPLRTHAFYRKEKSGVMASEC